MSLRTSLVFIISSLGLILYLSVISSKDEILITKGKMDLRNRNFEKSGSVELRGEWLFAWNQFIPPSADTCPRPEDLTVPDANWGSYFTKKEKLKKHGYATYQVNLFLPETGDIMALHIPKISEAYTLFINKEAVLSSGVPGKSIKTSRPSPQPHTVLFTPKTGNTCLTLHVSNFNMAMGGIKTPLVLGRAEDIIRHVGDQRAGIIFLASFSFITGLYSLFTYLAGIRTKAILDLGLFCLMVTCWLLVSGLISTHFLSLNIPWFILLKIEYISMFLAMRFLLNYVFYYLNFPLKKWIALSYTFLNGLFIVTTLLTKPAFFTQLLAVEQLIFMAYTIFTVPKFANFAFKGQTSYLLQLYGISIIVITAFNDMLNLHAEVKTPLIFPVGLSIFIFLQIIEILHNFYQTHKTAIKQRNQLIKNQELLERSRFGIILGLAKLTEYKDQDTGFHLERIKEYCRLLVRQLATYPCYSGYITERYIKDLCQFSVLHDIGKVAIPDAILLKEGPLNADEFEIMKQHPVIAGNTLLNIEAEMNNQNFFNIGKEIAFHHHEKWDGSGYPNGLKGDKIPLSARIAALADVYDALTSERPYKRAVSHEKAKEIIMEGRGSHFDPDVVKAFLEVEEGFKLTRSKFMDKNLAFQGQIP